MERMTAGEAGARFDQVPGGAAHGEEVEITRHDQSLAGVVPLRSPAATSLATVLGPRGSWYLPPAGAADMRWFVRFQGWRAKHERTDVRGYSPKGCKSRFAGICALAYKGGEPMAP